MPTEAFVKDRVLALFIDYSNHALAAGPIPETPDAGKLPLVRISALGNIAEKVNWASQGTL